MKVAQVCRWVGLVGISVIALLRTVVAFAPRIVFDVDPTLDPALFAGLGPAGSLGLDVFMLAACGLALVGESLSGRGLEWKLIVLALIPAPVLLWHGWDDAADAWRGASWLAAALAGVTAAHVTRDRAMRPVLLALLVAVSAPLLVRGAMQVYSEHAVMLETYREHQAEFLADRGWKPDSIQVRIYEERLRQAHPTGWFVTTNVYASLLASMLMVWVGLAIAAWLGRRRAVERAPVGLQGQLEGGHFGVMVLMALGCAWGIVMSGSKGAVGAGALGLVALILLVTMRNRMHAGSKSHGSVRPESRVWRAAPWLMLGAILLAIAAVVVRGALLPEDALGERSLLFRWHYVVGAVRMILSHGLLGVGPDGFQDAYVAVRLPRAVEEVASAHSIFVDWLATLGLAGAAWIALTMLLAWRSGAHLTVDDQSRESRDSRLSFAKLLGVTSIVGIAAIGAGVMVERHALDDEIDVFARLLGIGGFIAVGVVSAIVLFAVQTDRMGRWIVQAALFAAVLVLLVQSQIELTFFQPGAVAWCMMLLGVAGGAGATRIEADAPNDAKAAGIRNRTAAIVATCLGALILTIAVGMARPVWRQQFMAIKAATGLDDALDPEAIVNERMNAADLLAEAGRLRPFDVVTMEEAARQTLRAAESGPENQRERRLRQAEALADEAAKRGGRISSLAFLAGLQWRLARLNGVAADWDRAIESSREIIRLDPNGLAGWRRLGDVLWETGRTEEAAEAYREALQRDADHELDPLRQLGEKDREEIERRVGAAATIDAKPQAGKP